ncbi:hypothetical protein CEUSTIGMA_g5413.t1 [Chlamydomonas eustigma]|uniref:Uncharacterized protein n=1 Tax=Chlamydomonas eustigma TaxID=1157962 RepID=A0A250X4I1_9CHLO|nr:hypothetical protein CEUSTIGMA_g5413.t1 [Chlamydomonas eustigma]|eukprot:GAX77971.1 hypothetical protein CEUSTIGMA_g5413.t1 [Chlamydomonas eustigma]
MDMQSLMPGRTSSKPRMKNGKPCCQKKPKSGPWLDGTLNTEYRNEFIDKEVPVQRATAKNSEYPTNPRATFDPSTTYGGDFKAFQVPRQAAAQQPNSQGVEGLPFEGNSSYRDQYGAKAVPYNRVKPPTDYQPNKGEFNSGTTYGGDFVPRGVPQPARLITRVNNMEPSGPFEGQSLYKTTFTKMPNSKREPVARAEGGTILPKGAFDDGTIYRSNYVPKEIHMPAQYRPVDSGPINEREWFQAPSTEYRGQFFDKEVPRNAAAAPMRGGNILPTGPLDTSTTYGGDFKLFATGRQAPIRPITSVDPQKVPFEGKSSYTDAFFPKAVPYSRIRPVTSYEPNKAKFDPSTTHNAAFQAHKVVPTFRGGAPVTSLMRETHPFEGKSTYRGDFTKMPGGLRAATVGRSNEAIRSGPFDGTTTYRVDFIEKEIPARVEPDCVECSSCDEDGY